ncbi:MAG: hypothetical protein WKF92_12160 [Pyrinomonadaceae bacterium]
MFLQAGGRVAKAYEVHAGNSISNVAPTMTVTPLTWNIIGLDSNTPLTGPNLFPVGARVCNTGVTGFGNVTAVFAWDSANPNINLRTGSLNPITLGSIAAGICVDAYFEVEVNKTAVAFNTTRRYHITASDSVSLETGSTPQPRELYVERLISQNRNGVDSIKLNGTAIPAGGAMTLVVGNTYNIELAGHTATQGYNQLEGFINFPNTIFQTLAVSTTYTAETSPYVTSPSDKLYANACLWDDDPSSPNYRSCIGGDAKAGGTVITTYTVRIVSGGGTSQTLSSLLYDFSGSSFHYNSDYSVGFRTANIVDPSSVTMSKTFTPRAISPGGTSAMTLKLSNPTTETFTGANFTDTFPAGMQVAATPGVTYSGCGPGAFSPVPLAGATSLSFANGTLAANSSCTITVNVTAPAGTYLNTTGHLFINTSLDTGSFGQDTLTSSAAAPCTPGQTLATWSMPVTGQGSGGPPPPFTTKAALVTSATAATSAGMSNTITGAQGNPVNAWSGTGFAKLGPVTGDTAPYFQFAVDTSKYSGVGISLDYKRDTNWGGGGSSTPTLYVYSSTTGVNGSYSLIATTTSLTDVWQSMANTPAAATGSGTTFFRINGIGVNSVSASELFIDNIAFTGCGLPTPAPTIAKSFSPKPIVKGATTTLSFTINNTAAGNRPLTGVAFSDVMPAGLSIGSSSTAQCAGTLTTTAATRTIALTGGQLAAGGSCTFNVTVTGTTAGQYDNVTGYISSTESGTSTNYATDSLTVIAPPVLAKAFAPTSVFTGDTSSLAFTITNPNQLTALSGLAFTDTLPPGITVTSTGPTLRCGGSLTTTAPGTISFGGGSLAANTACTFSVTVTGTTSGSRVNTTSAVTSAEGGTGNVATATLVVNNKAAVIDLNKQVSSDGITWFRFVGVPVGGNVYYRFTVYNGGDVPLTGISVSDPTLAATSADPATCVWASPLAPGDTNFCVKGPILAVSGSHRNTATAAGNHATGSTTSSPSTATYATTGLSIVKDALQSYFTTAGDVLNYSYLVTNSGFAPLLGPVTVADDKSADETCPSVTTVGDFDGYLDPGESITCTATYLVQPADVTAGYVTNLASATASGTTSNVASKTVNVVADLSITKSSAPKPYVAGSVMTYTIVVTNSGPGAVTGAQVADTLPAALSAFTWTCTAAGEGASCGSPGGTGDINALVNLPAGTYATFSVTGTVPAGTIGSLINTATVTPPAGITDRVPGNNTATDVNPIGLEANLGITKTSAPKPYVAGAVMTYTIVVTNSGPSAATGARVQDVLPAELSGFGWTCAAGAGASCGSASGSGDIDALVTLGVSTQVTFTVTGTVPPGTVGALTNTATVTPPVGTTDPVSSNNRATDVNPTTVTAAGVLLSGRVMTLNGYGLRNAVVTLADADGLLRKTLTSSFGYYRFDNVEAGETYVVSVSSKRAHFSPQVVSVMEELSGIDFIAEP